MFVERLRLAGGEAGDVLGAAVVGEQAAQPQVGQPVDQSAASARAPSPAGMPLRVPTATSTTTLAVSPAALAASDRSRAFCSSSTAWMNCGERRAERQRPPDLARRRVGSSSCRCARCRPPSALRPRSPWRCRCRARRRPAAAWRWRRVLWVLACGRAPRPKPLQPRLHRRDVRLERVEIDAERRRVEIPLRHADAVLDRRGHLGGGVAAGAGGDPDVGGGRGAGADEGTAREWRGHSDGSSRVASRVGWCLARGGRRRPARAPADIGVAVGVRARSSSAVAMMRWNSLPVSPVFAGGLLCQIVRRVGGEDVGEVGVGRLHAERRELGDVDRPGPLVRCLMSSQLGLLLSP